jgi:glyceraldehyde 3-phosphate dehydrogenase
VRTAAEGPLKGIVRYATEPLVLSDIQGDPHSGIFDSKLTKANGTMTKFFVWYDNEWGYSARMVDVLEKMAGRG